MADKDCGSGRWEKNNLTWQWALDEMVVNVARRCGVQWHSIIRMFEDAAGRAAMADEDLSRAGGIRRKELPCIFEI